MNRDQLLEVYHRHVAAEQAHDHSGAAATYVEHGYYRVTAFDFMFRGRAAVAAQYATLYAAFPDARFEIAGEVVEGAQLFHWGVMHATATGSFFGQPPTGRKVASPFAARFEFTDGAMLGETLWYDVATLCDQVGVPVAEVRKVAAQLAAQLQGGAS